MSQKRSPLTRLLLAGVVSGLVACSFSASAASPPKNPYLADSSFPVPHGNSAQTTSAPQAGPTEPGTKFLTLFNDTITYTATGPFQFGSYTSGPYADGRRVMWSSGGDRVVKWDHDSLDVIAQYKLPPKTYYTAGEGEKHINLMNVLPLPIKFIYMLTELVPKLIDLSGIYSMVDNNGLFYVAGQVSDDGTQGITVYGDIDAGNPDSLIEIKDQWSLPANVTGGLVGMNMTFDGNIVLITEHGYVLIVSRDGDADDMVVGNNVVQGRMSFDADEQPEVCTGAGFCWVRNGYAVDEDGGIYVASRDHMHKLIWTGSEISTNEADGAWRAQYSNGLGNGTGSTPSLMGFGEEEDQFVVFTDGDELMNVVLMWRNDIPAGWTPPEGALSDRTAGSQAADMGPLELEKVQTEQSVVVSGYSAMVVNNEPNNIPPQLGQIDPRLNALIVGFLGNEPLIQPYGMQKFEWLPAGTIVPTCRHPDKPQHNCKHIDLVETDGEFTEAWANTDVSSLNGVPSVSDASQMVYTVGARNGLYTIEALDWETGEEVFHWFVGGNRFNSLYSGILINENGLIHYNTFWGKAKFDPDNAGGIPIPAELEQQMLSMLDSDPEQLLSLLETLPTQDLQELAGLINLDMLRGALANQSPEMLAQFLAMLDNLDPTQLP